MIAVWKWIGKNKDQIGLVFIVVGGIVFIFEYYSNKYSERISRAFETVSILDRSEYIVSSSYMQNFWIKGDNAEYFRGKNNLEELYDFIYEKATKDEGYLKNFLIMHDAFRDISWCARLGLCDWQTTCRLIRSRLIPFLNENAAVYGYYQEIKKTDHRNVFKPFEDQCRKNNVLFVDSAQNDFICRNSIYIRGLLNRTPGESCRR